MHTVKVNSKNEEIACGGWSEQNQELDDDLRDIFQQATNEYTPIKLIGTQVVAGMNYRFTALDKNNKTVIVTIFKDLNGHCEVTSVK